MLNQINGFRDISSENPIQEIWKLLRYFQYIDFTVTQHRRIREISDAEYNKHKKNIEKQAKQIGYCIRQAEEYFQVSSQVGLATRPNLLYYGAVSLSRALYLLKRDGNYSFDALRKKEKHKHHGLELCDSFKSKDIKNVEDFFNSLQCNVYIKPDKDETKKIPSGHFALFYESLIPCAIKFYAKRYFEGESDALETYLLYPNFKQALINDLLNQTINISNLLKTLPDIFSEFKNLGLTSDLCQGELKLDIRSKMTNEGYRQKDFSNLCFHFTINNIPIQQKQKMIDLVKKNQPNTYMIKEFEDTIYFRLLETNFILDRKSFGLDENILNKLFLPHMVDDIAGRIFYILNPENYIQEPAAHFVILFCLGMLCRYYPDVWIKVIDENVLIAQFTDSLLNIIYRKFPNLILDQMMLTKHHVHL
ncbi:MAG: YaaC family protein [Nostocaceae cyanobacterium]|nr:YaaC family protein [Nostocaceae cyanobacterium]